MNRVLQAARLHLVHPLVALGMPWVIVSLSFAINLAIWPLTPTGAQDGGVLAFYITILIVYLQAVTQLLPFGMGMGLSRRACYAGTALLAVAQSVAISAFTSVEDATSGWGAAMSVRAPGPLDVDNPALQGPGVGSPAARVRVRRDRQWRGLQALGPSGVWVLSLGSRVRWADSPSRSRGRIPGRPSDAGWRTSPWPHGHSGWPPP